MHNDFHFSPKKYTFNNMSHSLSGCTKISKYKALLHTLRMQVLVWFTTLMLLPCVASSQKLEKEPEYNYVSLGLNVATNVAGSFRDKAFTTVEFGRSFGIFDLGVMAGRLTWAKSDTSWFTEAVPTINVFSKGRFSEALTLGFGYVFNAKNSFLTEITNSINFTPTNQLVISLSEGNYFFDGQKTTSKAQYIGLSVTYNFIARHSREEVIKKKSLLN